MEDKELLEILKQYRDLKIEKEAIDKQMSILKNKIIEELANRNSSKIRVEDISVAYTNYVSNNFDQTSFKKEHKDLFNKYRKLSESSKFTFSVIKEFNESMVIE